MMRWLKRLGLAALVLVAALAATWFAIGGREGFILIYASYMKPTPEANRAVVWDKGPDAPPPSGERKRPNIVVILAGKFEEAKALELVQKQSSRSGPELHRLLGRLTLQADDPQLLEKSLRAFREVESALSALRTLDTQATLQASAQQDAARAVKLAETRYRAGLVMVIEVIDAQRTACR